MFEVFLVFYLAATPAASPELLKARDTQSLPQLEQMAAQLSSVADRQTSDARAQYQAALAQSTAAEVATELHDKGRARGASEAGMKAAERAVALKPSEAEYHRIWGTLCGQEAAAVGALGALKYGRCALDEVNKAMELDPREPMNYLSRGIGNYYLPAAFGGGVELAIKDFEKAIALDANSADAHLWLGIALRKLNRNAEAHKEFERAAKLNPARIWAKQQLEKLARSDMLYLDRKPGPPLDAFVASIWYCENDPRPHALEKVLPSGAAGLVVNLIENQTRLYRPESGYSCETSPGAVLSLSSRYCVIDTTEQERVIGVVFKPSGTVSFFRIPTHEFCDVQMPLDGFRERLLEAATPQAKLDAMELLLTERFTLSAPHPAVAYALAAFARQHSIAAVTDRIALSPKRFIEHFKSAVGVTPKHYCRIRRFQRTLAIAENGLAIDWTRVALDCGYFDQAHFIHDFRSFSGITPTGYQASRTEFRNHVKFLQSTAAAS